MSIIHTNIPYNKPTIGDEESEAVSEVINSGWLSPGRKTAEFEDLMCEHLGLPNGHALAVSSGSAALVVALMALDLADKNIAIPAYTCSSLRNSIDLVGGNPCYVDIEVDSFNMDVACINSHTTDAIIFPHMYGFPSTIQPTSDYKIIEDCSQAIGAKINGIPVGLQGDMGVFSFYATKLLTSGGQGGMVVSKDKSLIDKARDYIYFDCKVDNAPRFNFQLNDMQAAMGIVQLKRFYQEFHPKRKSIFKRYLEAGLPVHTSRDKQSIPAYFRAVLNTHTPDATIRILNEHNISAINPISYEHLLATDTTLLNSLSHVKQTVLIPLFPDLSDQEVEHIISVVQQHVIPTPEPCYG